MVFVDTPGIHKPRTLLGERLNSLSRGAMSEADLGVLVVDARAGVGSGDALAARWLAEACPRALAAVNKIDIADRGQVAQALTAVSELAAFDECLAISATEGSGVELLVRLIADRLEEGPLYYPEETVTDTPLDRQVADIVREKMLERLREELPHSLAVVVEAMSRRDDGMLEIEARAVVERESQKRIVVGNGGQGIRDAGTAARREIEGLLGAHVYLDLRVVVNKDWQRDPRALSRLGF
jgi:GTPase